MDFMFLMVLYMTPSLIAIFRRHKDIVSILMINILLGWTMIGWIIALIWSVKK